MNTSEEIKQVVRERYSNIALKSKESNDSSCCGTSCCSDKTESVMQEDYAKLKGYSPDADLGLGCGLPTESARIKEGQTVIDLGSGAGNDCFVARAEVGEKGKVIGIDFSEAMINKARRNAEKLGYNNVEFRIGEIENLPLSPDTADVVISNCVLNLVPDKATAFQEIFRVLKPGGNFSISDIVLNGVLPEKIRQAGEMYAGCISGALQKNEYLRIVAETGFENVKVQKERYINLPDETLAMYLTREEISSYKESKAGIVSVTVYAEKPAN